jgi:hypothetical protein
VPIFVMEASWAVTLKWTSRRVPISMIELAEGQGDVREAFA